MTAQELPMRDLAGKAAPVESNGEASEAAGQAPGRFHPDVATGLCIVAMCVAVLALTLTFDEVPEALTQGMGPAAFPRLVLGVIIVLALWLAGTASSRALPEVETTHRMVYLTGAAILGVLGAMALFGIHGAVMAACVGMGRLWGERRLWLLTLIAVGMSIAIHFAFVRGFGIGLPRGILQTWLS